MESTHFAKTCTCSPRQIRTQLGDLCFFEFCAVIDSELGCRLWSTLRDSKVVEDMFVNHKMPVGRPQRMPARKMLYKSQALAPEIACLEAWLDRWEWNKTRMTRNNSSCVRSRQDITLLASFDSMDLSITQFSSLFDAVRALRILVHWQRTPLDDQRRAGWGQTRWHKSKSLQSAVHPSTVTLRQKLHLKSFPLHSRIFIHRLLSTWTIQSVSPMDKERMALECRLPSRAGLRNRRNFRTISTIHFLQICNGPLQPWNDLSSTVNVDLRRS